MNQKLLSLEELLPGAVLAENVHDNAGRVLLRAGAVITEASIDALRRREIEMVTVEVVAEELSPEQLAIERKRLEARLDEAFARAGEGVANQLLRQAVLEFKLEGTP